MPRSAYRPTETRRRLTASDIGESRRHQNRLIDRTAHRRNPTRLVYGWANDGKVKPFAASDITIEDIPDVQTEIHVGYGLPSALRRFFNSATPSRAAIAADSAALHACSAIFGGKDGKRAVADQLKYITAMFMDR